MKSVNLVTNSVKILGIYFSYNEEIMKEKNFISVIKKIENVLAVWRMRSLTLAGKITVLKSLIFAKIVFISFLSNIPSCIIKKLIVLKREFLWDGKPPKIKHSSLVGSYERGGLKDIDIEKRVKALRISWVRRLYDGTEHEWKIIPKFFLDKISKNIFYPNLKIKLKCKIPMFYKNVIKDWEEIAVCNPLTMCNVMMQPICYNGKILVNGEEIKWESASNLFVKSFYDENGHIIDWSRFKQNNEQNDTFFLSGDKYWMLYRGSGKESWLGIGILGRYVMRYLNLIYKS